jgi:hypothetical protein
MSGHAFNSGVEWFLGVRVQIVDDDPQQGGVEYRVEWDFAHPGCYAMQ